MEGTRRPHQYDQLHQAFTAHQDTYSEALSPHKLAGSGGKSTANDLCDKGHRDNSNDVCPGDSVVEETEVGAQTRECEIKGEEEDGDQVFNLLCELNGESAFMGADQSHEESAKNWVDSNYAREEC